MRGSGTHALHVVCAVLAGYVAILVLARYLRDVREHLPLVHRIALHMVTKGMRLHISLVLMLATFGDGWGRQEV